MNIPAEKQQSLRHQFDAYCKKVIKYEKINHYREMERRRDRQILFCEMSEAQFGLLSCTDEYFADEYVFLVVGYRIPVKSPTLAEALIALSEERRNIVLMYYYLGMGDREIGAVIHRPRNTVGYNRLQALRLMRVYIEAYDE